MAGYTPAEQAERRREAWRRWAAKNKPYLLDRHKSNPNHNARGNTWRANNPERTLLINARSRAKKQGIPFSITEDDVVITAVCPALGIPLVAGVGKPQDGSPSLDKINPSRGYVPGNVQVISYLANSIKYTATGEQILLVAHYVLSTGQNREFVACVT
jgi:hypothetical protein